MADRIKVHVCYATAATIYLRALEVDAGSTIVEAIRASGILAEVPGIDLATQPVGVFSKKKALDAPLHDGDRIEIYRPLIADPKDSRRKRAEKKAQS
ncbi:MAG: RnfH family protein [Pseudomonadota bacterium]